MKALSGRAAGIAIQSDSQGIRSDTETAQSEVVVVGYGASKKKRAGDRRLQDAVPFGSERIVPAGGWQAFRQYLETRKKSPDPAIKGAEEILFSVNSSGRPERFLIIMSLSRQHDAEVIRLLSEGPAWKYKNRKATSVRLIINF
jgi:hypothetical protein